MDAFGHYLAIDLPGFVCRGLLPTARLVPGKRLEKEGRSLHDRDAPAVAVREASSSSMSSPATGFRSKSR